MSDAPVTRGFVGRRRPAQSDRLPPGQYDAGRQWPVLSAEPTPQVDLDRWTLTVDGAVLESQTWDWSALRALPHATSTVDIHCVTTWSRFDTAFTGVSVETLLDVCGVASDATHVVAHTASGYTTNLPLDDVRSDRVRLLVPHLYFWKSAKGLTRLGLLDHDEPGFWERGGYHDRGDPWLEQRYQGDP